MPETNQRHNHWKLLAVCSACLTLCPSSATSFDEPPNVSGTGSATCPSATESGHSSGHGSHTCRKHVRDETLAPAVSLVQHASSFAKKQHDSGQQQLSQVHVMYAISNLKDCAESLLSSMLSLSRNIQSPGTCTIHLIAPEEEMGAAMNLSQCFRVELARQPLDGIPVVSLHKFQKPQFYGFDDGRNSVQSRLSGVLTTYARWYAAEQYFPELPRIIWLDYDTIIEADATELFNLDMNFSTAGVTGRLDGGATLVQTYPELASSPSLVAKYSLNSTSSLINAGVLLLDLDRWRSERVQEQLEVAYTELASLGLGLGDDQLTLNLVLQRNNEYDKLESKWNYYNALLGRTSCQEFDSVKDTVFHFSSRWKPWQSAENIFIPCSVFDKYRPQTCGIAPG